MTKYMLFLVFFLFMPLFADPPEAPAGKVWVLTLDDEFDGTALNSNNWSVGYGWGRTRSGTEEYIHEDAVAVENGLLKLKVLLNSSQVRSGAVNSKNKFVQRFGCWEASIHYMNAPGTLQAFWFKSNSEDWPPECDISEFAPYGNSTWGWGKKQYHHNLFYKTNGAGATLSLDQKYNSSTDLTQEFHTYCVWWDEAQLRYYLDGQLVTTMNRQDIMNAFNANGEEMYTMLSVHVEYDSNSSDDWFGKAAASTWGKTMEIDWVRVWALDADTNIAQNPVVKPTNFTLEQNYPNPFNSSTTITYDLDGNARVKLEVFDVQGHCIESLVDQFQTAGPQNARFSAGTLPTGCYLLRLATDGTSQTRKMLFIR